jgi:surfeit locus 1 family protein
MIALGFWQLRRADEKRALIAQFELSQKMSSDVAFPELPPVPAALLYRHSSKVCLEPISWRAMAGRSQSGKSGFRMIAACRTGAEGPGMLIDMGISTEPRSIPTWKGGAVDGVISLDPDQPSLIARLFGYPAPARAMLVADKPAPGLQLSARPSPGDTPNNHLAYAVQWFLFAAIAALIYALALRRKRATP